MTQDRSKLPVWAYVLAAVVVVAAAAGIGALAFSGPQYAWSSAQVRNGRAIIVAGVNAEVPDEGIVAALDAAITETDLYVYANPRIPESLHEPYQRLGTDGTSLGVLQQRARCGSVSIMDPEVAASHFYRDLRRQPGWRTLSTAEIAATIQRGAFPERYNQNVPEAEEFFSQHVQEARAYVRSWRYPGPPGEECGRDFLSDYAGSPTKTAAR